MGVWGAAQAVAFGLGGLFTIIPSMIASVSGILILRVVPWPILLWMSTVPPIFSRSVRRSQRPTEGS